MRDRLTPNLKKAFQWFIQVSKSHTRELSRAMVQVFKQKMRDLDLSKITKEGFEAWAVYFVHTNMRLGNLLSRNPAVRFQTESKALEDKVTNFCANYQALKSESIS